MYVSNAGALTLVNPTIIKSGDTSSDESSSFYGLNAGVLATSAGQVSITDGTITTTGRGANGAMAVGAGTMVTLAGVTIDAQGDGAHAVMATQGGEMSLTNVVMTTTDAHSGAIATDRGSGVVHVSGGSATTSGADSPAVYSTGTISVADATLLATGAEAAVIEGSNTIALTNSTLKSTFADKWGVMIYQSFSGDAEGSEGDFTMTGGALAYTSTTGPLFYVNNATGKITLKGVDVTAASGVLVKAAANERWGTAGENGGHVLLVADAQTLAGDVVADSISTMKLSLVNGSSLTGAINEDATAKSANLSLDATSVWHVTADSHLTCLSDAEGISGTSITNIIGNGHTVYYDPAACPALNGQTFTLAQGGSLTPAQ